MTSPLYFDQGVFQKEPGKSVAGNRHSFVRFCASEFSLENYIGLMCVAAYRKSPTLTKLQTFYVALLKPDSPLQINVSKSDAAPIVHLATVAQPIQRGFLGRTLPPPRNVMDAVQSAIEYNISDIMARWQYSGARYNMTLFGPSIRTEKVYDMMKMTTSGSSSEESVKALNILESGGYPVRHMGLTGVVQGF